MGCPTGGIPEQEECGDNVNGGCDMEPGTEYFEPIECGTTICGTAWADGGSRDTDWYVLSLSEEVQLRVTGQADFPFQMAIISPGPSFPCQDYEIEASAEAEEDEVLNLGVSIGPGDVWIRINNSGFDGNPCGGYDDDYYFVVDCVSCDDFITIEIITDDYPDETSWELIERGNGVVVASAGPLVEAQTLYIWHVCANRTLCYDWNIYDSFGDGLFCDWGYCGLYWVYGFNGELLCYGREFGYVDSCTDIGICAACEYVPGDCDHDGNPLELEDVISMIGTYRGSILPSYQCLCPSHGYDFTPTADPNGNCVPNELNDVVAEIGAYRGTDLVSGCPDCPGQ